MHKEKRRKMLELNCQKTFSKDFSLNADFIVPKGQICALYGASGAGKTSILRIIAGLERASGYCKKGAKIYFDKQCYLPPQERNVGFLFQDYALFENYDVLGNLLFAKKDKDRADFLLDLCGIYSKKHAKISTLSGGEKQRVALSRALMREPELLLLDEPFSALDSISKTQLSEYLLKAHESLKSTILLISHDKAEIYKLCSLIIEVKNGKTQKIRQKADFFSSDTGILARILDILSPNEALVLIGELSQKIKLKNANSFAKNDEIIINLSQASKV